MPASGESIGMQYRDALPEQRAHCIADMFHERTANESEPLSRERILQVIQGIVAELEEENRDESAA